VSSLITHDKTVVHLHSMRGVNSLNFCKLDAGYQ
jgi:hypothetical protein